METKELLQKTKEHLIQFGWIKNRAYADVKNYRESPSCIMGAMAVVSEFQFDRTPGAEIAINDVAGTLNTFAWNDAPERTFDEVIDTIDAAIASL